MLAFWPEKSVIDHPLNYNLYKKKDLIEHDFIRDYGILQKDSNWEGYGFKLENIEKIEPIEINGKLSLWDYNYKDE